MIWLIKNYSEYELVLDYLKTNGLTFEKKPSNNKRISVFISGEYTAETRLDEITTNIDDENSEYEMGSFNNEDEDLSISNFNSENADSNDNTPETSHSPTKENGSLIEVKSKHSFTLSSELKSFNNESAQVNQMKHGCFHVVLPRYYNCLKNIVTMKGSTFSVRLTDYEGKRKE